MGEAALTALNVTMIGRREFVIATAKAALRSTASEKETEAAAISASDAPADASAAAEVIEEVAVDGVLSVPEARRQLEGRQLLQQIDGSLLIDFDESSVAALPPPSVELHAPPRTHLTNDVRWAAVD